MLPKELLEVRRIKGRMYPKFASNNDVELAAKVIEIYRAGKRFRAIKEELKGIENAKNYKKVRGFSRIIKRRCIFETESKLDPKEIRFYLFSRGYITKALERSRIVGEAAKYFKVDVADVERAIFADREEEQVLKEAKSMDAQMLIKLYNLSLLQTALFDSLRLTFWTSSNHKEIFRRIKWLGLMYELLEENKRIIVEITGAASILKMIRKYGTAMAKLIPSVIKSDRWKLKAEVLENERIYTLEISDEKKNLFPAYDEALSYDSSLEEEFRRKIREIKPDIEIIREPGVIKAGRYAFIPDFLLKGMNRECYAEIVGFWTEDYIKRKVEKIKKSNAPIIVLARQEYGLGKIKSKDVILFSKRIPYNKLLKMIKEMLKADVNEIEICGDILNIKALSDAHFVEMQGVVEKVKSIGYIVSGSFAVKKDVLEKIKKDVDAANPKYLSDVKQVLDKYGVSHEILELVGYKVRWKGLSEENAKIFKIR
jgi:hypothetical protein